MMSQAMLKPISIDAPTISGFTPSVIGTGTSVVITGTNFTNVTSVKFATVAATSFTINSDTQITAVVPALTAATGTIVIVNDGGSATSTSFTYAYLYDTFTGTDATNLTAHALDVGPAGYSAVEGTMVLSGNKAICSAATGAGFPTAYAESSHADMTASVVINFVTNINNLSGLSLRVSFAAAKVTKWRVGANRSGSLFDIREVVDDSQTTRATTSVTFSAATNYTIACVALGATLTATVDGANSISYALAATNQTVTLHGPDFGGANSTNQTLDTFLVTP